MHQDRLHQQLVLWTPSKKIRKKLHCNCCLLCSNKIESTWALQAECNEHTQPSGLLDLLPDINDCFRHQDVESIVEALQLRDAEWATNASKQMAL